MAGPGHDCDECGAVCDCGFDEADCTLCSDCYTEARRALDPEYDADDEEADDEGYGHGVMGGSDA